MRVPTYSGPCKRCGKPIEKYVRPGKEPLCLHCGIAKSVERQLEVANPESELFRENLERGAEFSQQFARAEGEWYEKWRGGMERYLKTSFPTEHREPATVPVEKPPARRRTKRRG